MQEPVLARVNNDEISQIRDLSERDISDIKYSQNVIFEFNRHFKLIEYVLSNFIEFRSCISETEREFERCVDVIGSYKVDQFKQNINIRLLNLIMSIKTLLDHMETHAKRTYGKESGESALFKKLTALEFDSYFSYGFMYKLRNYVQHCGMPPIGITQSKVYVENGTHTKIDLYFGRDNLLNTYDGWGKIVRENIESQDGKLDAIKQIDEFVNSIITIFSDFTKQTTFDEVISSRDSLLCTIGQSNPYFIDDYCLLRGAGNGKSAEEVKFNLSWIPASVFRKIERFESLREEI